jgi:acetyltransferase
MSSTTPTIDPAHGGFRPPASPLDAIFAPRAVAVIGASERAGSVGRALLWNLISSPFGGTVYPVNPKHGSVLGVRAYRRVAEIPEPVDLAIVATPAVTVPGIIGECADARVRGAIIVSAGFRESGPAGAALEREVRERAERAGLRILGPNCLGVMRPTSGLNASFAATIARPGHIAFISQSGALGTAILDWSLRESVGFSAFASLGSMLDIGWGDIIDYFGDDPKTRSIVLYMESIDNPRAFLSAAREVALTKPILVLKAGRGEAAARAVQSHTGAMSGHDDVLDAAFRRCGVHRAETIGELFALADAFEKQPRPQGGRLAIVTNAGGPGVLAADALTAGGGQLAELAPETVALLNRLLPPYWSKGNPVDVLGDADPQRYLHALEAAAEDAQADGLLVILTPQAMTNPTETAQQLAWHVKRNGKPVLACWMGGSNVAAGREILASAGIPTFSYPESAVQAFLSMGRYRDVLRGLYQTPTLPAEVGDQGPNRAAVAAILEEARATGRTLLTEPESKQVLAAYGIPIVDTRVAASEAEAVALAERFGYPVVLKIYSQSVTHKTDVDGVRLGLPNAKAVRSAFREIEAAARQRLGPQPFAGVTVQPMVTGGGLELLIGSSVDPQFGPVILFGSGGILTGVYCDRALALAPINSTLARRLMERTRIFDALKGVRGRGPVDIQALEHLLVRFSRLVTEQPRLKEIDINPLLATSERLVALDARIILHGAEVPDILLPRPAIRSYPAQYVAPFVLKDKTAVTIRPIRPEDEPLFVKLHGQLSERSVYYRFFHLSALDQRTAHERLTRVCFIDYDREMALVAERDGTDGVGPEIVGVGRLRKIPRTDEAQFAILVADAYQNRGLGTELMRRLMQVGRDEHLHRLECQVLPENREMHRVCAKVGGSSSFVTGSVVRIEIDLTRPPAKAPEDVTKPPLAAGTPATPVLPPQTSATPAANSPRRS